MIGLLKGANQRPMTLWDRPDGPQGPAANSAAQSGLNVQGQGSSQLPCLQTGNAASETMILNPQQSSAVLNALLKPNTGTEQTLFNVVASGYIKTTASSNITLKLYSGTSTTPGSNTLLKSSGTVAQNSATAPYAVKAELIYDSVSGKLTGEVKFFINNSLVAAAAVTNVVTGVSNSNNPVLAFALSITSSGDDATHLSTINVQKFSCG